MIGIRFFLKLRESADIAEGDKVIVIGNPRGFTGTVSDGIVSAFRVGRSMIQITAPISRGSSGSPVLDENGEVIGVATLINNQGQNLNFAIAGRAIRVLVRGEWMDKHPEAAEMMVQLNSNVGGLTDAQFDRAKSTIEKYLADRSGVRNDFSLDVAAKKAKLDQLGQEYDADIGDILIREQKERFDAAREREKKDSAPATSLEEGRIVELLIKNYSPERTRPRDRNGSESSAGDQNEHAEFSALAERRERILKLRLANEVRRWSLEQLRRRTITIAECVESMDRIKRVVSDDLLRLPASLCHDLANHEPRYIQQVLDTAFRSSLDRLNRPENYL